MGFSGLSWTFLFLYWGLVFEVPCLNCFQFIEVTQNPLVVVVGHNSTDVKLRWEFDLVADNRFSSFFIYRYKDGQYEQTKVEMGKYFSDGFTMVTNDTLYYALNASSAPPRGFASFLIKNILSQVPNNKDGSKFDPLNPDVTYAYRIKMTFANLSPGEREKNIKLQVKVRVHNFKGPNNESLNELQEFNVSCSADGKPPPTLTMVFANGDMIKGTQTLSQTITAYRNLTGMYNCTADNKATAPQTKTAWINVWYTPDQTRFINLPSFVCLNQWINLTCKANGHPSNISYTFKNGSTVLGSNRHGSLQIIGSQAGVMNVSCTPSNAIGTGQVATRQVRVIGPLDKTCKIGNETITSKTVEEGSEVVLLLTSSGMDRLNFTWNNKTDEIPRKTGHKLTINRISRYQGGQYQVLARDRFDCSDDMKCNFTLNVQFPSSCTIHPNVKTVIEGDNVSLNVTTTGNPPVTEYNWTHPDGSILTANRRLTFTASRQDAGIYNVSVDNGVGVRGYCTSDVKVQFPSTCEIQPSLATVNEGDKVVLNVITTGNPPVYEYNWTHPNGSRLTANSILTFAVSRNDSGIYNVSVYNGVGVRGYCTSNVTIQYFDKKVCKYGSPQRSEWLSKNEIKNVTNSTAGFGYPGINIKCWSDRNDTTVSRDGLAYTISVDKSESNRTVLCLFYNEVGNCYKTFTILERVGAYRLKFKIKILNINYSRGLEDNSTDAHKNLKKKIEILILKIYKISEHEYLITVYVISFREGSVWVNLELELIANVPNPIQPLQDALLENKGNIDGLIFDSSSLDGGFYTTPRTPTTTPTKTQIDTTGPPPDHTTIIIIVVVVVVVLILAIILILCYRKKKREKKESGLVEDNPENVEMAANNEGFSPGYAERGPSHIDPAYDSVDRVQKGAKDKNDNPTQPGSATTEPTYAAVDKSKKTKKKDEILYAQLEGFQKNGDTSTGARGGVVLEPLPKGPNTKMPVKYEETIYAEITGMQKKATDNQDAAANAPLGDMDGQGTGTEPEQQKAANDKEKPPDNEKVQPPTKEDGQSTVADKEQKKVDSDQKPTTNENQKPPANQQVQTPTKEDSGKEESDSTENSVTKF